MSDCLAVLCVLSECVFDIAKSELSPSVLRPTLKLRLNVPLLSEILWPKSSHSNRNPCDMVFHLRVKWIPSQISFVFKLAPRIHHTDQQKAESDFCVSCACISTLLTIDSERPQNCTKISLIWPHIKAYATLNSKLQKLAEVLSLAILSRPSRCSMQRCSYGRWETSW